MRMFMFSWLRGGVWRKRALILLVTLFSLSFAFISYGDEVSTAARMQEVVKRFVKETGYEVIGVGSWIKGSRYRLGVSDHDMRLLLPKDVSAQDAQKIWIKAQDRLREMIEKEFGSNAKKVLERTNLYPPSQLVRGLESVEDAMDLFARCKRVPNLGVSGSVSPDKLRKFAEGIYGRGAGAYIQSYERAAGKLFYRYGDKVYVGLTDLAHWSEGVAKYSVSGAANTASQWLSHLDEILKGNRDAASLVKYLERLERDLVKARDMARFKTDFALRERIRDVIGRLNANPRDLHAVEGAIRDISRRASLEVSILKRYESAGSFGRMVLGEAMDSLESGRGGLGKVLEDVKGRFPDLSAEKIVNGLLTVYLAYSTSRAAGEGNMGRALSDIMTSFTGLTTGVTVQIAQAILDSARENGYSFAAASQSAFDLIEGVFTGLGRAGVSDRRYTLDQLVSNITTEEGLKAFVMARAREAASRDWGPAGALHDLSTAEAIFDRCYPVILRAWQAKREMLAMEVNDLLDLLESETLLLIYSPYEVNVSEKGEPVDVTVTLVHTVKGFSEILRKVKGNLKVLVGPKGKVFADANYFWSKGGREGGVYPSQIYSFSKPGVYRVEVEQLIGVKASGGYNLSRDIKRKAFVEIPVVSGKKEVQTDVQTGDFMLVKVESKEAWFSGVEEGYLRDARASENGLSAIRKYYKNWVPIAAYWNAPPKVLRKGQKVEIIFTRLDRPNKDIYAEGIVSVYYIDKDGHVLTVRGPYGVDKNSNTVVLEGIFDITDWDRIRARRNFSIDDVHEIGIKVVGALVEFYIVRRPFGEKETIYWYKRR